VLVGGAGSLGPPPPGPRPRRSLRRVGRPGLRRGGCPARADPGPDLPVVPAHRAGLGPDRSPGPAFGRGAHVGGRLGGPSGRRRGPLRAVDQRVRTGGSPAGAQGGDVTLRREASSRLRGQVCIVAAVAAAGALVTFAAGRSAAQTPVATATGSPRPVASTRSPGDVGERLYLRDCAWCHVANGGGSDRGPSLIGVGAASADFMLSTGRMPTDEPTNEPPRRSPRYTRAEIDAITRVIASFGPGPPIPAVDPA